MDILSKLACKYKTDKGPAPEAHPRGHNYTPIYNMYFEPIRLESLKVLEIGVGGYGNPDSGGESLRVWNDYFPSSEIVAIDIERKNMIIGDRVRIFQGSQVDREFLQAVIDQNGPFDIIIDDGSHLPDHHIISFDYLFHHGLKSGGIYVIEDLNTVYEPNMRGQLGSSIDYFKGLLDVLHMPNSNQKGFHVEAKYDGLEKLVDSIHCYKELFFIFKE